MAKQINCPKCAIFGETTAMILDGNHFRCPECRGEFHDNADGDDKFIRYWQQQQQYRSCSLPEGVRVHGGSDPTGTTNKEKMRKKSVSEINKKLYG